MQRMIRRRLAGVGAAILAMAAGGACRQPIAAAATRPVIRLVRDALLGEPLAAEYAKRLPDLEIRLVDAEGSVGTVAALQHDAADLGFVLGDVAYFAHQQAGRPAGPGAVQLRGVAALQLAPIHLLVRPGLAIQSVRNLHGYRIGVGTAFSGQALLAELLFRTFDLGQPITQPGPRADLLAEVDAAFATAYYPAGNVERALAAGARLVPIDGPVVERLRRDYPFIQSVKIPAHTYPGQSTVVKTIGVDRLLLCRSDLDDAVVHDLTRVFLDALPVLASTRHSSLRFTDLDLTPATPVPLHPGAAQFYRERELQR